MNIAICLKGHMRTYDKAFYYIDILKKNHNVDVFIHTWEDLGYLNLYNPLFTPDNPGTINLNSGGIDLEHINNLYNSPHIVIEQYVDKKQEFENLSKNFVEWFEQIKENSTVGQPRMHSFMSQFYKEKAVIDLKNNFSKKNNKKYDIVIVTRPDTFLEIEEEILEEIKNSNNKIWADKIIYDMYNINKTLWVCNSFFAGNESIINMINNIYNEILEIYNTLYDKWKKEKDTSTYSIMYCIHRFYGYYLTSKNINPVSSPQLKSTLIR